MSEANQESLHLKNTGLSRRDLFRTAGMAAGGAILLGLPKFLGSGVSEAEAAIKPGALASANLTLKLDGQFAGYLSNVDGGGVFADIIMDPPGPDMIQRKRTGPVRYEDIVVDIALSAVEKPLSAWITETLTKNVVIKNGAIVYADMNYNETKRLEFTSAILSEIGIPDANANEGKNAATLTLRLVPQSTRLAGGKGKLAASLGAKNKHISTSNFRFNVQGLEKSCGRISKVEGVTVTRTPANNRLDQDKFRQSSSAPGAIDCSKVSITLPEIDAGPFYAWFDDMVINGRPGTERAGVLEWLDPTLKNVVASVQLGGLGIVRYEPDPIKAGGAEKLAGQVQIDMYCETVNLIL